MMDRIEETLDAIYGTPPVGTEALDRLRHSVQQWQEAIWYDALRGSAVGPLLVAVSDQGVVAIEFGTDEAGFVRELEARHGVTAIRSMERSRETMSQILQYLSGDRRSFELEIDLRGSTEFQRKVLEAAVSVPPGYVATYGEIAARIGKPQSSRAVGQALARNPIPIIVPCHRVVAADGALTGYSGAGGIETKAHLLRLEGATIA
ncbi:MAG: methylated-DNA--[protein]-cysteine S-methyltransferase [Anaerolineales bacterium]